MRQRRNQWWLAFFLPGTLLVLGHTILTRLFGLVLPDLLSGMIALTGMLLLVLSLFTQLPWPTRRKRK